MKYLPCILLLLAFVSTVWSATPKEKLKNVKQEINAKKKLISKDPQGRGGCLKGIGGDKS
jgi:hypothetical protein